MTAAKSPKKVLIAEDNPDSAEIVTLLLEAEGHKVRVAYDGLSALQAAQEFKPDIALSTSACPG
jgi:CheY-like chemotaxis protein